MKRLVTLLSLAVVTLAGLLVTKNASAEDLSRVAGSDRYNTAVEVSKRLFASVCVPGACPQADAVILVNGETLADALASAPLAKAANGTILFTKKNTLPLATQTEIQRVLKTGGTIYILGGTGAISQAVQDMLGSLGYNTKRLAGVNRMDTSVLVAMTADSIRGTAPTHIYLVNGYRFADGLAVGPLAAVEGRNILVTEDGDLSQVVRSYVNGNINTLSNVSLVGGDSVLPQEVMSLFVDNGFIADRIDGKNRYHTATLIADRAGSKGIGFVSGFSFADALSSGALLTSLNYSVIFDQPGSCLETAQYLQKNSVRFIDGFVVGGLNVVSLAAEQVAEQLLDGIKACP